MSTGKFMKGEIKGWKSHREEKGSWRHHTGLKGKQEDHGRKKKGWKGVSLRGKSERLGRGSERGTVREITWARLFRQCFHCSGA